MIDDRQVRLQPLIANSMPVEMFIGEISLMNITKSSH
jgi:hypothetical protein